MKFHKKICVLLMLFFVFNVCVLADEKRVNVNQGVPIEKLSEEELKEYYQAIEESKARDLAISDEMSKNPSRYGLNAHVSVDIINQENGFSCGPASAIQTLSGLRNAFGGPALPTIVAARTGCGTTSNGSNSEKIRKYLNDERVSYGGYISFVVGWSTVYHGVSPQTVKDRIYHSLINKKAPIVLVRTEGLQHYSNIAPHTHGGHYVTVSSLYSDPYSGGNFSSDAITIVDPNNYSSHRGRFNIRFGEADNTDGVYGLINGMYRIELNNYGNFTMIY